MSDTPISNDLFQYRNTSGVYASCYDRFSTNAESLCQFDYPEDFATTIEPWNYPPDTFTTHFTLPGDQSTEIKVMLFGEVLSEIEGTALGAMGGSSLKRDQGKIKLSGSKARDRIALGVPTCANAELSALFFDQITTLNQILEEVTVPGPENLEKRQWTKFKSNEAGGDRNVITVALPYKYTKSKPESSTKLRKRQSDMDVSDSKTAEVSLEATYDPRQLNDYDPDIFDSDGARLVQQPMYDETAKLVTPREEPSVFTSGALVAAEAQLLIHHFLREPNANHLYQIAVTNLVLLDPSPVPYKRKPAKPIPLRKQASGSKSAMFTQLLGTSGQGKGKA